jgi:hypothetical protein
MFQNIPRMKKIMVKQSLEVSALSAFCVGLGNDCMNGRFDVMVR